MPIELHRLELQLATLQVILEDAIKNGKPFIEQTKISKQISEIENLIEKRKELIKSQEGNN